MVLAAGSCGRSALPTTTPEATGPREQGVQLRYRSTPAPLRHELELDVTHTSLGLYLEAKIAIEATLSTTLKGRALSTEWTVQQVSALELVGTVDERDDQGIRTVLTDHGGSSGRADDRGFLHDGTSHEGLVRAATDAGLSAAAVVLLTAIDQHARLPLLPEDALAPNVPVEHEEESETVLTDLGTVLPTTTVVRYTLRGVDELGVAEIAIERASVAESGPEAEGEPMQRQTRATGMLLFDVERGLPVSLELSQTEQIVVGEQEVERTVLVRSRYRSP